MSKDNEKCEKNKKNLCQPFFQGHRQFRHGTALGTYIGRDLHRQFMGIGHLLPAENGSGEGCRERVTGSNGVRHRYLGRLLEGNHSRSEHIAAVRSTSLDKHFQVIFSQQNPAFVLQVDAHKLAVEVSAYVCTQSGAMPELPVALKERLA